MFANRLGEDQKSYMTRQEFLTRFWAAYTYEEDQENEEDKKDQEGDNMAIAVPTVQQRQSQCATSEPQDPE